MMIRPPSCSRSARPSRAFGTVATTVLCGLLATTPAFAAPPTALGAEAGVTRGEAAEYPLAQTGPRCRASIEVSSPQILSGESVTISGAVECQEAAAVGGQTVTVLAHTPGGPDGFTEVASATSEPDGSYRIPSPALDENTILFVRLARGHSARRRVRVTPQIGLMAPVSGTELFPAGAVPGQAANNTVAFAGTVTRSPSGELAVLQGELPAGSGRWRRIAVSQVDLAGHFLITHTFRRPGEVTVRVLVRSRGTVVPAASEPLTYTVAARPRPHHVRRSRTSAGS
jgi:hypothetical protein